MNGVKWRAAEMPFKCTHYLIEPLKMVYCLNVSVPSGLALSVAGALAAMTQRMRALGGCPVE